MYDDGWMKTFSGKAGPRLRLRFEEDLGGLPAALKQLLQTLRETEPVELPAAADEPQHRGMTMHAKTSCATNREIYGKPARK
jgi:hypothetical protein